MSQDSVMNYLVKNKKRWVQVKEICKATNSNKNRVNRALRRMLYFNEVLRKNAPRIGEKEYVKGAIGYLWKVSSFG